MLLTSESLKAWWAQILPRSQPRIWESCYGYNKYIPGLNNEALTHWSLIHLPQEEALRDVIKQQQHCVQIVCLVPADTGSLICATHLSNQHCSNLVARWKYCLPIRCWMLSLLYTQTTLAIKAIINFILMLLITMFMLHTIATHWLLFFFFFNIVNSSNRYNEGNSQGLGEMKLQEDGTKS